LKEAGNPAHPNPELLAANVFVGSQGLEEVGYHQKLVVVVHHKRNQTPRQTCGFDGTTCFSQVFVLFSHLAILAKKLPMGDW